MRRFAALLVLGLLTACAVPRKAGPNAEAAQAVAVSLDASTTDSLDTSTTGSLDTPTNGAVCRVGSDGGPLVAERGIGGTGAPRVADRGIGGTGIVGVITGFASVCVDGLEVKYDSSVSVDIDGTAVSVADLRAGQIVAIQAQGQAAAPVARTISVRREVTGRIEAVELGSGLLTIAGQPVSVPAGTWGADSIRLGDWVAVSGLRRADGTLIASRLDAAPESTFAVRGPVVREEGIARIGQLVLNGSAAADLKQGEFVAVSGQYAAGRAQVSRVAQDTLFPNPAAYFGTTVNHLVVQAYVSATNGAVWLNGLKVTAGPGFHRPAGADGLAVVSLERKTDGSLAAVGLRYTTQTGAAAGAVNVPNGGVRRDSAPPAQVRRGSTPVTVSTGEGLGEPAGGQPATTQPATSAASTTAASTPMAPTVTTPPVTTMVTAPVTTTVTAPVTTTVTPPVTTIVAPPPAIPTFTTPASNPAAGLGAIPENVPAQPSAASALISRTTTSGGTSVASGIPASKASGSPFVPGAGHPVIIGASSSTPTLSQITGAVTVSPTPAGSASVVDPSVLAASAAKSKIPKPIGTPFGKIPASAGGTLSHGR
jgi:Domain of unknown function (DUF5666)